MKYWSVLVVNHKYEMAIDFSGPYVNFCVRLTGSETIQIQQSRLMQRRDAATICSFLQTALAENNIKFDDISKFTVGSGPGSFTGMRIVAALVSGMTFGKETIRTRTVPSAFAIAAQINLQNNENAAVIFDGRNKEVILFEVSMKNDTLFATNHEAILNKEQAVNYFTNHEFTKLVTVEYDLNALKLILPEAILTKLLVVKEIDSSLLLDEKLGDFNNDLTALHYIRPSVIAK